MLVVEDIIEDIVKYGKPGTGLMSCIRYGVHHSYLIAIEEPSVRLHVD